MFIANSRATTKNGKKKKNSFYTYMCVSVCVCARGRRENGIIKSSMKVTKSRERVNDKNKGTKNKGKK